jgi:nitroreductase
MELFDVMRTAFSAREFTGDPVPDEVIARLLDHARFAPSGGNRQGWRVVVVRDPAAREALAGLGIHASQRYVAQLRAGEHPWNSVTPTRVDAETIERTPPAPHHAEVFRRAPVVLVIGVDLRVVASVDQHLPRVGVVSGASIYPFVWNVLLAARHEGLGGVLTTIPIAEEPRLRALLGLPEHVAVAALVPLGRPARPVTRLRRHPVEAFARLERWDGPALPGP